MPQEHPDVRMPPPLLHLGGIGVGYGLDQALHWRFAVPAWLDTLSLVLAIPAALLALTTLIYMLRRRTTVLPHHAATRLLVRGPFAVSRNPIYLSFAALHLACGLALGSPGILIMLVPVVYVMDRHVIAAEEAFHAIRFGDDWISYRARVRRWLGMHRHSNR